MSSKTSPVELFVLQPYVVALQLRFPARMKGYGGLRTRMSDEGNRIMRFL